MLLKDFINNNNFDINCRFKVYSSQYGNGGECLYDSYDPNKKWPIHLQWLYEWVITYITIEIETYSIIIEVKEAE